MFSHTKDKKIKVYNYLSVDDIGKVDKRDEKIIDNPTYNGKPRPDFCKKEFPGRKERIPNYKCLENDCPHFGYTEYEEENENPDE